MNQDEINKENNAAMEAARRASEFAMGASVPIYITNLNAKIDVINLKLDKLLAQLEKATPKNGLQGNDMKLYMWEKVTYICQCLSDYQYYPFLIFLSQVSRNTLSVVEAVHESSARINEIVPDHSKQPSWRLRITPIIKTGCGQAESEYSPLGKIARFVQGIVLFKESTLYLGFSCN